MSRFLMVFIRSPERVPGAGMGTEGGTLKIGKVAPGFGNSTIPHFTKPGNVPSVPRSLEQPSAALLAASLALQSSATFKPAAS
jgi:hypothetical protein